MSVIAMPPLPNFVSRLPSVLTSARTANFHVGETQWLFPDAVTHDLGRRASTAEFRRRWVATFEPRFEGHLRRR